MKQYIRVEVEVDNLDNSLCANDCEFNDNNVFCQLFCAYLQTQGIRCQQCLGGQSVNST